MKRITFEEIPHWFDINNYKKATNYSPLEWHIQLGERQWMYNFADRLDELNNEEDQHQRDLFFVNLESIKKLGHIENCDRLLFESQKARKLKKDIDASKEDAPQELYFTENGVSYGSIHSIDCGDIAEREKKFKFIGLFYAQIDLFDTDEQLINDFRHWMKIMRIKFGFDAVPKNNYTNINFEKWINFCILGFIDLEIWSKFEDVKIPDNIMGKILYPKEYNIDLSERIRKVTRSLALKVLHPTGTQPLAKL